MTDMAAEPCDTAEPQPRTVPPLHWWDLRGQIDLAEVAHINDIQPVQEWL